MFLIGDVLQALHLPGVLCSLPSSLPRHSATLLKNKLLIFGGRRTSVYLSDMHILDLGKKVCARWMGKVYSKARTGE